ncbi:MAG: 30S ribosomal protein S12 methylthiotransferase RimO [Coriobacteriia bacterium]|nr:30S ribosomal protein S12 methylthiotransferase RimO [Coriobacteriia bacterium]
MATNTIPTVAFTTLGCPKNEVDTDLMRRAVEAAGYYTHECTDLPAPNAPTDMANDSLNVANCSAGVDNGPDAIVVNTCSFIQEATEASIEAIFDALGLDEERSRLPVIVAGCIVNRYADDLTSEMPEVTALIKVGDTKALVKALTDCLPAGASTPIVRTEGTVRSYEYLRIADGCDRRCTFCTIPSIRGAYTSRRPEDILTQARDLVAAGTYELIVIAQDIGRYGTDLDADTSANLVQLLSQLAAIPELKRLRLMYLQPEGLTDELLQTMAGYPNIVPYLEVPLQHIEPRILKTMGRNPRDVQNFETQLAKARKLMPELVIRTTLIAGFPGETDEEFAQLCNFVERANLDYVGVFPYSPEEGTIAAKLPNQLDDIVRLERAQQVRDLADQIGWQRMADRIGQQAEVLVEGYDSVENVLMARAAFQAPDIDGIVRVTPPEDRTTEDFFTAYKPNTYLMVEFTDVILYDLDAVIVSS